MARSRQQDYLYIMVVFIKLLFTAVFWGGTFIAGRSLAGQVAPFSAAFLRFAVATVFLLLFLLKANGRIPAIQRKQLLPIIVLGLTGVFSYNFFFFKGLERIEAGRAAVIIANNPVFIALLSALLFKERLRPFAAVRHLFVGYRGGSGRIEGQLDASLVGRVWAGGTVYLRVCAQLGDIFACG